MFGIKDIKLATSALAILNILVLVSPAEIAQAGAPGPVSGPAVAPAPSATPPYENDKPVIQGDQFVIGGSFTLGSGKFLNGDLTVLGGMVTLAENSRVEGNLTLLGGSADINGVVTHDLTVLGGMAHLRSTAHIEGREFVLGGYVTRDPGAVISGQSTQSTAPPFSWLSPFGDASPIRLLWNFVGNVFSTLASVVLLTLLAVAIAALFPVNLECISRTVQKQWLVSGSTGLVAVFLVPMAMVVLAITICLIPAALVILVAWVLAMLGGWSACARLLGERLAIGFKATNWTAVGQTALGAVVLAVLGALPLIGWLIGLLAVAIGMGALLLTIAGTRPLTWSPVSATQPPPPGFPESHTQP